MITPAERASSLASAAVDTIPWHQAPEPTLAARDYINDHLRPDGGALSCIANDPVSLEAGTSFVRFNEVLSCCYVAENGGMKYHSDDEKGVGPVVASLSLGTSAVMSFKPRTKKKKGRSEAKREEDEDAEGGTEGKGNSRPHLAMFLRHGDVVVQAGAELQKRWLHAVATKGFRIVCTARKMADA